MTMHYIRTFYGVPARHGGRVIHKSRVGIERHGTITGAHGVYLRIRFDGERKIHWRPFHPVHELTYVEDQK